MKELKPYRFQRKDIDRVWNRFRGRALMAWEMGLGKSPATLWGWHWNNDHPGPLVIVCPAYLKLNWEREVKLFLKMRAVVLDGETPPMYPPRGRVYIINYDILTPKKRKRGRRRVGPRLTWVKVLRRLRPSCIVVDESQYLKEMATKRTKDVRTLQKGTPHFLALSGTGCIENCPAELFPVLNMIQPKRFATFYPFGTRYCQPRKTPWGTQYKGATNTKELNKLLKATVMVRRQAADVLKDLPPLRSDIVTVPLTNRKEYDQAEKDLIRWLMKWSPKAAKRAANAERLVKWAYLRKCIAEGKFEAVKEWVADFLATGKKLLLFGFHTAFLAKIHDAFKGSLLVTGKTPPKQRDHLFHRFNSDPAVKLMVGNIDAAGTGWSCRATSTVAFCELVWNPAKHRQAAKRVHGINRGVKGEPARTVYLITHDTVEEMMAAGLQRKQKIQDQVLDGRKASGDMDLMSMLEKKLLRKVGR